MSKFDTLHKYASEFVRLAQIPQMPQPEPLGKKEDNKGATFSQADYPTALYNSGLSPWASAPTANASAPGLDYQSAAFTKYINPALDAAGTQGKVNIKFSIDPNKNVIVEVSGDPTAVKVQAILQKSWGTAMSAAMHKAAIVAPTALQYIGSVLNYG